MVKDLTKVGIFIFNDFQISQTKLVNEIIDTAIRKAKYEMINPTSYRPKTVTISIYKKKILAKVSCTAQNDYGATKDTVVYLYFSMDGEFIR